MACSEDQYTQRIAIVAVAVAFLGFIGFTSSCERQVQKAEAESVTEMVKDGASPREAGCVFKSC